MYIAHYSPIVFYSVVFSTFGPKDLKERISDSRLCTVCPFLRNVAPKVPILNLCDPQF